MIIDINKINNIEDRTLISDSIKLCEQKFYRASYIMAWLSCAESLKRRFYELGKRDENAGAVSKKIKGLEEKHSSVDNEIIENALKLNLISDVEKQKLLYFFKMRSVYSHPYECAPNETDCLHIIKSVFDIVLSHPVLLKEGGISFILGRLTKEKSFLNDSEEDVKNYVSEITPLIDSSKYNFLCEKYMAFLENETKDQDCDIIFRRGICFIKNFIKKIDVENIWTNEEFENVLYKYRKTSLKIFTDTDIFKQLANKHQSIIINRLQEDCKNDHYLISYLDNIFTHFYMTKEQTNEYLNTIRLLDWSKLKGLNLSIKAMYQKIIASLKSYNWNIQNPACQYITYYHFFADENQLDDTHYINLGRNILQAYDGNSYDAFLLLCDMSKNRSYPVPMIQGVIEECFYDENEQIRLKIRDNNLIENVINILSEDERNNLLVKLLRIIKIGRIKRNWNKFEYEKISDNGFIGKIKEALNERFPVSSSEGY